MNRRVSVILLIALVVSAAASYVVYRRVAAGVGAPTAAATAPVIVASRNLAVGTLIKDADLKAGSWSGPVPKGIAVKKEDLVGRGVIAGIYEGEAINESRLAPVGAGAGLAATIPPGMRACAVRVNEIVGVAGFVVPGMRVDVLISGAPPGGGPMGAAGPRVKTLLQNIEVLSAGQNYQKDAEGKPVVVPVVNLLVTPEQAEILSLASNETRIQLVLRNPLDTQVAKTSGVAISSLFGEARPAAPAPRVARPRVVVPVAQKAREAAPAPSLYIIEVINGPKRGEAKFPRRLEEQQ